MKKNRTPEERLMELFAGSTTAHGTHREPDWEQDKGKWSIRSTAKTLKEPVTRDLWSLHLSGDRPLGVVVIREDSTCQFASIDVDVYDSDLLHLVKLVADRKLPIVPVRSKSGGLHLFLFLTEPIDAKLAAPVLRDLAAALGVAGSELFPKQTRVITKRGDIGSWIIMPYYGGTFDGKLMEQVALRKTGAELELTEFLDAAEKARITPAEFLALSTQAQAKKAPAKKAASKKTKGFQTGTEIPFGDGPPCLQHLSREKIPSGGQNNALLMMGIYYKKRNADTWKDDLSKANNEFLDPPGSMEGLQSVIRSLSSGKDYEYTCKVEPMCSHCDSSTCITRKFGVGDPGNFPRILGISKLGSDDPLWFIDIEDTRLEVTTLELQNYTKFHAVCMEKLNKCYAVLKQSTWLQAVSVAMENIITIEPAPDIGPYEEFRELLEEFLTNRTKASQRDDLLTGRPWEDEERGRYYFRMRDFQTFLAREGVKDMRRGRISQSIRRLGGEHGQFNLQGHGTNVWWVPASVIDKMPDAKAPPIKESPI